MKKLSIAQKSILLRASKENGKIPSHNVTCTTIQILQSAGLIERKYSILHEKDREDLLSKGDACINSASVLLPSRWMEAREKLNEAYSVSCLLVKLSWWLTEAGWMIVKEELK